MTHTVTVLMSTYNGEKYLKEQIDSVLSQNKVKVYLLVRDDGSSDSTVDILSEYQRKGEIDIIRGENVGWRKSFMELVYLAPKSEYYAFCDQDDIWLPDKLSVAIGALEKEENNDRPLLYGSNLYYYKNGEKSDKLKLNTNFTKQSSLIRTLTCGCTLVFNHSLYTLLRNNKPNYIEAHDSWVFLTALYLGKVVFDPNAYILYRQHGNNQIGAKRTIIERLKRGKSTIKNIGREQSKRKAAEEFLRVFYHYLGDEDKRCILKFANYNRGLKYKFMLLCDNRYTTGEIISDIFLKFKILTNTI